MDGAINNPNDLIRFNKTLPGIKAAMQEQFPDVSFKNLGSFEFAEESLPSLLRAFILAVVIIYGILVILYNSYVLPFVILLAVPMGFIGVNFIFYLHGKPFSFFALVGAVGLIGVVINDAIILVSYMRKMFQDKTLSFTDAIVKTVQHRFIPVLVTTMTTVGGLIPTAYGIGGYDSVLVPLTLSLASGLLTGMLLSLIIIPCVITILHDMGYMKTRK